MTYTRTRTRRIGVALAIAMLVSGACASTEHRSASKAKTTHSTDTVAGGGAAAPGDAEQAAAAAEAAQVASGKKSRAAGAASAAASGKAVAGGGAAVGDKRVMGHGITASKIQLGMAWIDINAFIAAVSAAYGTPGSNESQPTTQEWAKLAVAYQNAHGGIAGRQIDPVYYQYPVQDLFTPQGRSQAEQEMCSTFTKDNKVFAMLPLVSNEGVLTQCAKTSDTPAILTANTDENVDTQRFSELGPWWYRPSWISGERRERAMVARLVDQGFFAKGAKVGLMVEDKPQYRRAVANGLKPALAKAGISVATEIDWPDQVSSPWDSYVLQMSSAGVTNVIWSGCGCSSSPPALFMRSADNQHWNARHALGSEYLLNNLASLAPHAQLKDLNGIAWSPDTDMATPELRGGPVNSSDALCRSIMVKGGIPVYQGHYCEFLFFLAAALAKAPALNRAGMATGVEALGDSYVPVMTAGATFGPGRHDGVTAVWQLTYDDGCQCIKYKNGPKPVG